MYTHKHYRGQQESGGRQKTTKIQATIITFQPNVWAPHAINIHALITILLANWTCSLLRIVFIFPFFAYYIHLQVFQNSAFQNDSLGRHLKIHHKAIEIWSPRKFCNMALNGITSWMPISKALLWSNCCLGAGRVLSTVLAPTQGT